MSVLQASLIHEMATKDPCRANSYENPSWHVYGGGPKLKCVFKLSFPSSTKNR